VNCQKVAVTVQVFKQCSGFKAVRYCGHKCQKHHWSSHKGLCQANQQLEAQGTSEVVNGDGYVFASHLTPKQQITVAKLVGKKFMVSCALNRVPFEALWDTGAQVSIVSKSWLSKNLSSSKLRNIEELLREEAELNLRAANGGIIPFTGWVEVQFQIASDTHSSVPLTVPILVARDEREHPIIGYTVIDETIKDGTQVQGESDGAVSDIMNAAFRDLTVESVNALVDFVRRPAEEYLCVLRGSKNNTTVPQGQTVMVPCRVDCGPLERRIPVLF